MTDAVSPVAIVLAIIFILLAVYVILSSYVRIESTEHQLSLHYPFSRQGLVIKPAQFTITSTNPQIITIKSKGTSQYRFWLGKKQTQQVLKYWEAL